MRREMMTKKITNDSKGAAIEGSFPAIAEFVCTQGWIEIGDQEGFGFIVRALDYGGLVYESKKPRTLAEAMKALERGIANKGKR
jgi:hypothetical protein